MIICEKAQKNNSLNVKNVSLCEKAQKNNSLNVKNVSLKGKSVEEKKLYLADYLKCDKYRQISVSMI